MELLAPERAKLRHPLPPLVTGDLSWVDEPRDLGWGMDAQAVGQPVIYAHTARMKRMLTVDLGIMMNVAIAG